MFFSVQSSSNFASILFEKLYAGIHQVVILFFFELETIKNI